MNRLMLDYFRRWSRVLAVVAVAEFALGGLIALGPEYTYEFWAFMLSLWAGATLLSFDFRRGLLRPVAVVPLTGRQIGRSWWLATVPIPAIVLAALLFSGAGVLCHFRPNHAFPVERLVMGSLFTLVWLGIQFTMQFNVARGFGQNRREFIGNFLLSVLTTLVFFGSMLLCQNASTSPVKSAILLGLGGALSVVGWVRAEQFDPGRAGIYLGRIEAPGVQTGAAPLLQLRAKTAPAQFCAPSGYGGIRFLLRTASMRAFIQIAAMVALMMLLFQWQSQNLSQPFSLQMLVTMGTFMPCWFIVFYQFMPMLSHLRVMRTLPLSATRLAGALLVLPLLPLAALGSLTAAIAWPLSGPGAALAFSNTYLFALGGVALCVFLASWRGAGPQAYALLLFCLFCFLIAHLWLDAHFHYLERPLTLAGSITAACLFLAFVLTRQALLHSSRPYRVHANPFGGLPMR